MRRPQGFTLIEVMTVAFLSLVVLTMVGSLMWPSVALYRREQSSSDAYQSALLVMHKLMPELLNAAQDSITLRQDATGPVPSAISFVPVKGFSPAGTPLYGDRVVFYYHDKTGRRVVRGEWQPKTAPLAAADYALDRPDPPQLTPDELAILVQHDLGQDMTGRVAGREVSEFTVTDSGPPSDASRQLQLPLVVRVHVEVDIHHWSANAHKASVWLDDRVTPRNLRW